MLTKKDFNKVAEILRYSFYKRKQTEQREEDINDTINKFCEWFKSENKDFNEDKFGEAVLK